MYYISLARLDDDRKTIEPSLHDVLIEPRTGRDHTIPRIRMYRYIVDALRTMPWLGIGDHIYIYEVCKAMQFSYPAETQLPEVGITKEVWSLRPIDIRYKGTVETTSRGRSYILKMLNREITYCDWDWKYIDLKV